MVAVVFKIILLVIESVMPASSLLLPALTKHF